MVNPNKLLPCQLFNLLRNLNIFISFFNNVTIICLELALFKYAKSVPNMHATLKHNLIEVKRDFNVPSQNICMFIMTYCLLFSN